jgi:predicted PurR-regulated permease PerM
MNHVTPLQAKPRRPENGSEPRDEDVAPPENLWEAAAHISLIGLFFMASIAALYFARSIVMPVVAALIVGITMSPIVKFLREYRVPSAVTALMLILAFVALIAALLTLSAAPATEWINRAPEIGNALKEKLRLFDSPLAALRDLKTAVTGLTGGAPTVSVEKDTTDLIGQVLVVLTPAVTQFIIFFGTLLFFLISHSWLRQKLVIWFRTREARLLTLRIWNDIEAHLVSYVGVMTLINLGVGACTTIMLYLIGFPNPPVFGLLAFVLNYVPYIGPGILTAILFGVGLVALPSLGQAMLAPALFIAFATIEGHFITPTIIGRRLTLGAFPVFLALAFWTWLWGPIGAFLAVPLLIVSYAVFTHLLPPEEPGLPG